MEFDIILISAEPYVDHPFSGAGLLKKVLEDKGFSVGVIESPDKSRESDFKKLGRPKLFFGICPGSMDSMLLNYTPLKKKRQEDVHSQISYTVPDRSVIVYCNILRKLFKDTKLVIGGIESSLRRFCHYDYWDNKIRKSILLDSRADILVYGYGELQLLEIAQNLKSNKPIIGLDGTCIVSKTVPEGFELLPSYEEATSDKLSFCRMQSMLNINKNLAQQFDNRYVLQYKQKKYTTADLDYIYSLDYSRKIPVTYKEFEIVRFSVLTHRGCLGGCNFCCISANTGKQIISRSKESIISEIKKITALPEFNGIIELSAASANMYGMDCPESGNCTGSCLKCSRLDKSHKKILSLLRASRQVPGVKKVVVRSGVRYGLALHSPEYIRELVKYHIDDKLMIAPEHICKSVLECMNKDEELDDFIKLFDRICSEEKKSCKLGFYFIVGHPQCTVENSKDLAKFIKQHKDTVLLQVFTPTPMTVSTCMYYTGFAPDSNKKVYVPYTYNEKKRQKNIALGLE